LVFLKKLKPNQNRFKPTGLVGFRSVFKTKYWFKLTGSDWLGFSGLVQFFQFDSGFFGSVYFFNRFFFSRFRFLSYFFWFSQFNWFFDFFTHLLFFKVPQILSSGHFNSLMIIIGQNDPQFLTPRPFIRLLLHINKCVHTTEKWDRVQPQTEKLVWGWACLKLFSKS